MRGRAFERVVGLQLHQLATQVSDIAAAMRAAMAGCRTPRDCAKGRRWPWRTCRWRLGAYALA